METKLVQTTSTNMVPYLEMLLYYLPPDLQVLTGTWINIKTSVLDNGNSASHFYFEITEVKHRSVTQASWSALFH